MSESCKRTMRFKFSSLSLTLLLLASCVAPNIQDWPDSIPQTQVFSEIYLADEVNQARQSEAEYLQWVLSFYQGNLAYQSGWQDIEGYMFDAPSPELAHRLRGQISELGVAIGSEWAKHNDVRQIDTRMLSLWGSTIQLAPDFESQKQTVEVIAQDVALLLDGGLEKEEILDARYAAILGFDLFDDF